MFEIVLYISRIDPAVELAWTKWLQETEEDYNQMFMLEAENENVSRYPAVAKFLLDKKWSDFVRRN